MDLAAAKNELYAGSPQDFVERRKALVAEARAAKDRQLATAIAQLRRPTRSAWLVNLYAREESGEVAALLELGAALQAAQSQLAAPELRRLSGERQKTLAAATKRAVALGEARGYAATEAVRQEVTQTLQAALAESSVADDVRAGTVTEAHAYGGFGVFGTSDLSDAVVAGTTTASDNSEQESEQESEEKPEEEQRRAEAEQRLHQAESELSSAADEADRATEHADQLADRVESLRTELAEAERSEAEARAAARAARQRMSELEAAVREAREAYEELGS